MSETVTYGGTYVFPPSETPLVGRGVSPVYINGRIDHNVETVELVGFITGENLSGLHLQKMQMISGLLPEFKALSITNDAGLEIYNFAQPENLSFQDSDLTTILPYNVSFRCYKDKSFSSYFGVSNPVDNWSFKENDGRITNATHTVSAVGVKTSTAHPLMNAKSFVDGRITSGFRDLSLFQTGVTGFLTSRTENIDKSASQYGITEVYSYNTSERPVTDSGIFKSNTRIGYDKQGGLSVTVDATLQGRFDANKDGVGLLHTGIITEEQATDIAINAVVSSLSDYESGLYTFIERGPKRTNYTVDTGKNEIKWNWTFEDPENVDQVDNVLHTKSATVNATKDNSTISVAINGELTYNSPFDVIGGTGDAATGARFRAVDARYSGIIENSGFLNLATEALQDFRADATGYRISGSYLNQEPTARSINKSPADSKISYSVTFDNKIDLSSGTLSGLRVSINDKKPISLTGVVPSIGGFATQEQMRRTAGEYQVSATCEADTGTLQQLKDVISGHMTGIYTFSESSSVDETTLSYNTSRYY
jgi:hypothetical protein